MNWDKIENVYNLARKCGVSFSINYEESCDSWYGTIDSPAPAESFVSKSWPFEYTLQKMEDWMKGLRKKEGEK